MEMYLLLDQQLVLEKLSLIGVIGKPNSRPACPTKVMEQAPQCSYSFSLFLENLDLHVPGRVSSSLSFSPGQSPGQCALVTSPFISTCMSRGHLEPNPSKPEFLTASQTCSSCSLPHLDKQQLHSPSYAGQKPWSHPGLFLSYSDP